MAAAGPGVLFVDEICHLHDFAQHLHTKGWKGMRQLVLYCCCHHKNMQLTGGAFTAIKRSD